MIVKDLLELSHLAEKPALFQQGNKLFWDDPHISSKMLEAHLDPYWEAASRPHLQIDRSVDWLVGRLCLHTGSEFLDLGCGPGLYCIRLAKRGVRVTGVDYSRRSIEYARASAVNDNLDITYVYGDYLETEFNEQFDAAVIIYYDFGVLSDDQRDTFLGNVYRALKPGGLLAFDVITVPNRASTEENETWRVATGGGFWRPGPYLELTRRYYYPEAFVDLEQTIIVDDRGIDVYRIWNHSYTPDGITAVLNAKGFKVTGIWSDLCGSPYALDSKTMGIVAEKEC